MMDKAFPSHFWSPDPVSSPTSSGTLLLSRLCERMLTMAQLPEMLSLPSTFNDQNHVHLSRSTSCERASFHDLPSAL